MGFDWKRFAQIAQVIAPVVIGMVNPKLNPLASTVGHAIAQAEDIPNADGPQKLEYVKAIANDTANAINLSSNKETIPVAELDTALEHGINTAVAVINLIGKANQK